MRQRVCNCLECRAMPQLQGHTHIGHLGNVRPSPQYIRPPPQHVQPPKDNQVELFQPIEDLDSFDATSFKEDVNTLCQQLNTKTQTMITKSDRNGVPNAADDQWASFDIVRHHDGSPQSIQVDKISASLNCSPIRSEYFGCLTTNYCYNNLSQIR